MASTTIRVRTPRPKQVIDITERVERWLAEAGVAEGLCNLFVQHTTAALTVGEAIEGTDEDLMETLVKLIPKIDFRHGHDPSHAPDHMIASIVGQSLTVPVGEGRLLLGTWQRILLVECNGPRERSIAVTVVSGGGGEARR